MYGQQPGQGPPSPPPPPPPVPPMGPPAPRPNRPSRLLLVVVGVGAVLAVAAFGVLMFTSSSGRLTGPLKADQCVDTGFAADADGKRVPASERVKCDDSKAKAKVLKVTDEGKATGIQFSAKGEPDCPSGTDGVTNVTVKTGDEHYYEACVRNLKNPHPGDPGAGGALLTVGDCVSSGSVGFGKEQPCSGSEWYGKVIGRVPTEKECPAKTLETMQLRSFAGGNITRPVLCLGAGGGVLASGDCIEDPSFNIGDLDKADCGGSQAVAKVVGRAATEKECPTEATHFMTSKGAYRPVLCLKKLRPTLNEQLRSLGR